MTGKTTKTNLLVFTSLCILSIFSCNDEIKEETTSIAPVQSTIKIELDINEANRLSELPLECIQNPLPYKSGLVIAKESDLAMPKEHHPAFYGCF